MHLIILKLVADDFSYVDVTCSVNYIYIALTDITL